jgi:hypothetical protein
MLREGASRSGDEEVWVEGRERELASAAPADEERRRVDRTLRGIAKARGALDAKEARWLREAERLQIWKSFGMVNMVDYIERVLGHAPRTAQQRMQVARALEHLPEMAEALDAGELHFSAVRELVRVATPSTEAAWRAHVGGMNLRQIEEVVAGHKPGDLPSDAPDPDLRTHRVVLELGGAAYALWRQAGRALDEMHERHLDDDERATAMANAVLEHVEADAANASAAKTTATNATDTTCLAPTKANGTEGSGRARYQIALTVCRRCDQAWQEGGGVMVPVDAPTLERARCDAQHIGSLDGDGPERAHQAIPPSIDRFVRRRDGGRCQTPGCRSALGVEIHHIVHREHGGTHAPSNLTLRCSACHDAHHRGVLVISGTAPNHIVTTRVHDPGFPPAGGRRAPGARVGARFEQAAVRTQARDALVGLGWKPAIASAAVDAALASGDERASLEGLIREALRRCPLEGTIR